MTEQAKSTVETGIKDKLKIAHGLLLLLSFLIGQIDFSTVEIIPQSKMIVIIYVGFLVLLAFYEDHRHKEKTGHYPQGLDIVDELIRWAGKVCKAQGIDLRDRIELSEDSGMPEMKPTKKPMEY